MNMELLNWDNIPTEQVSPLQLRQVVQTPQATVVRLVSRAGATVPLHHHVHVQITMLISGSFRFEMDGEIVTLRPGDLLQIPSDVPHQGAALADSVTVEVFIPAREDLIAKATSETAK